MANKTIQMTNKTMQMINKKCHRRRATCVLIALMSLVWIPNISAQTFEYPEYPDDYDKIAVKSQGSHPTITNFVTAFLNHSKENEHFGTINREWLRYLQKKPLSKRCSIILDTKNGYMRYEKDHPEEKDTTIMEMCFWNCADGKHKMVCANTIWKIDGDYGWREDIGPQFYLYDNATKVMRTILPEDIGALFESDGLTVFFLPRKGKNIKLSAAGGGDRWDEVLEWDGYQFNLRETP